MSYTDSPQRRRGRREILSLGRHLPPKEKGDIFLRAENNAFNLSGLT
jgi:hypothetical protein